MMKAVICTRYGPPEVLQLRDVKKPTPKKNQVLIKVHATSVHIGDTKIRRLYPGMGKVQDVFYKLMMRFVIGFRGPRKKILGMELAGIVEEVGTDVKRFKVGDEVFGTSNFDMGTYAEYCCLKEKAIITLKPENMSFGEAAPFSNGALTALKVLQKAPSLKGKRVLIYGASGSVGTFAVQLAKYFGGHVTGVCSTANLEMVKSIGADEVIDYTKGNFNDQGLVYDVIFDAVGKIARSQRKISLAPDGKFFNVLSASNGLKLRVADLEYLAGLCEKGHLRTVVDRHYTLDQIVEAHRYVDQERKRGHVVVDVV